MEYAIETKSLTRRFGSKVVTDKVNLHVKKGDVYGFIGKNGAGKTTTMKMILGLLYPTSGEIILNGGENLNSARRRIGSLIETPALYKNCSAFQNLKRFSKLYGGTNEEIKEILNFVGLGNTGSKHAGAFSLGMRQRLGIAIALLGNPEILILDEPVNGLDPEGIKEIRDLILKVNKEKGVTVLISSHLLDELSKVVTTYGIINNGVLLEEISAEELTEKCGQYSVVHVNNAAAAADIINNRLGISCIAVSDTLVRIENGELSLVPVIKELIKEGFEIEEAKKVSSSLEDYFISRMGTAEGGKN